MLQPGWPAQARSSWWFEQSLSRSLKTGLLLLDIERFGCFTRPVLQHQCLQSGILETFANTGELGKIGSGDLVSKSNILIWWETFVQRFRGINGFMIEGSPRFLDAGS